MPIALLAWLLQALPQVLPQGFADLAAVAPHIGQEMRYAGSHNFTGAPVPGYSAARCLLTVAAAQALRQAQDELEIFGLGLKVYDCYRPERSVAHFAAWAEDAGTQSAGAEFFPRLRKQELHRMGYIAHQSAHSRGSTVDLTLVPYPPVAADPLPGAAAPHGSCIAPKRLRSPDTSLDMGTGYDCLDPLAHTASPQIAPTARINRLLLREILRRYGFINYAKEWWHYSHFTGAKDLRAFNFVIEPDAP